MSAASYIRWHVNNLVGDKPFSIRDFLIYGSRNTVDQVFYKLVALGRIIRVARGVYIKCTAPMPSVTEVALVKAKAFCKTIAAHGSQAGQILDRKIKNTKKYVFAVNGATSSFRVGWHVVRFVRTSARKMQLGNSAVGLAIRALWYLGKKACAVEEAVRLTAAFRREDIRQLRRSAALMPAWLRDCFAKFGRMDCQKRDLETL